MHEAQVGIAWRDIAASAYLAYSISMGNRNFCGDPIPAWADLPRPIQVAWECAVRQVDSCIQAGFPLDVQRWKNWVPPEDRPMT